MKDCQEQGWISIIIPVYNAITNINKCLLSLEQQSYRKLEIIFINDCSTDESMNKINSWSSLPQVSDFRIIKINHHRNKGVAAARNTGLSHAKGEYIYYLDSDDYIEYDTLEQMYKAATKHQADIVGCEWFLSFNKRERYMSQPNATCGLELFKKMCYGVMRWNLWLFLVKREIYIYNDIHFIEKQNMGEDMMVMMKLSLLAKKVVILHQPFYHYIQTNVNSLTKCWSNNYRKQVTKNVDELEHYVETHKGKEFHAELECLKLNIKLPLIVSGRRADYKIWLQWYLESNSYIWHNKEISLRTRFLQYAASKHCFWLLKIYHIVILKFVYGILYR